KITQNYEHIEKLRDEGIGSSRAIVATGKERFTSKYATAFGGKEAAESAWERAGWLHAAAQQLVAATAPIFSVPISVINTEPAPANPALPDWEKLFGSVEMCECEQCRTVISPAAYLTDILHF